MQVLFVTLFYIKIFSWFLLSHILIWLFLFVHYATLLYIAMYNDFTRSIDIIPNVSTTLCRYYIYAIRSIKFYSSGKIVIMAV